MEEKFIIWPETMIYLHLSLDSLHKSSISHLCIFLYFFTGVSSYSVRLYEIYISQFSSQHDLDDPERGMIFVCSATHKTKVSYGVHHISQ